VSFNLKTAKVVRRHRAAGDVTTRRRLLQSAHGKERFENHDPEAPSLSEADARLLIANQEGRRLGQIRELLPIRGAARHRRRAQRRQ